MCECTCLFIYLIYLSVKCDIFLFFFLLSYFITFLFLLFPFYFLIFIMRSRLFYTLFITPCLLHLVYSLFHIVKPMAKCFLQFLRKHLSIYLSMEFSQSQYLFLYIILMIHTILII